MNEQAEDDILTNPDDLPGLVQSSSGDSDGEGNATSVSMDPQIYGPRWFSYSGGGERSYSAAQLDKRRWEMDQSEMRQGLVRVVSGEGTIAARYHRCATLSCRCCARGARASVGQERDGDGPERNAKRATSRSRRRGDHRCTGSLLCDLVVSVLREKRSAVVLVLSLLVIFHAESLLAAEGPRVGSSGGAACTNPGTEGGIPCADAASSTTTTYHSSEWEKLWLDNIGKWQDHGICEALANQTEYVHAFMRDTCCAKTDTPWCLIDDSVNQYWYHSLDGRLLGPTSPGFEPPEISRIEDAELRCTAPRDTKVWSWFERRNVHTGEVTVEYIEPLVSHLRHPLALCGIHGDSFVESFFVEDKSYVLPGTPGNQTQYLFDAGSSLWSSGLGGPSLSYFAEVWQRSGFDWAQIEAWDGFFSEDEFYASVPPQWQAKTIFHQEWIAAHHGGAGPFLPAEIEDKLSANDYVVFKLDIDAPDVENRIVDYMLGWHNVGLVDEFLWEQHVTNYLMASRWKGSQVLFETMPNAANELPPPQPADTNILQDATKSIADSYNYFLRLRKLGVRAHSWV